MSNVFVVCAWARLSQRKMVSPHNWSSGIEDLRSRRCCHHCEMPLLVERTANGFRKSLLGSISKLACYAVSSFHAQGRNWLAVPFTHGTLSSSRPFQLFPFPTGVRNQRLRSAWQLVPWLRVAPRSTFPPLGTDRHVVLLVVFLLLLLCFPLWEVGEQAMCNAQRR